MVLLRLAPRAWSARRELFGSVTRRAIAGGSVSRCAIGGSGTLCTLNAMRCPACGSTAVNERPERTAHGYRRFRCGDCGRQFNERSASVLNRAQYPSDVIALVVLWRLRYKLSLRDLAEMFLTRGFVFSYEAVRDWETKLTPALAENLWRRRKGRVGRSWYVDETYLRVRGLWRYLYRAIKATPLCDGLMCTPPERPCDDVGRMRCGLSREAPCCAPNLLDRPADEMERRVFWVSTC